MDVFCLHARGNKQSNPTAERNSKAKGVLRMLQSTGKESNYVRVIQ